MKRRAFAFFAIGVALAQGACAPRRLTAVELLSDTLKRDLLAHWAFDDALGTSVRDDSPYLNVGTVMGGTGMWLTDGRFAGALRLAEGEYVSVLGFPPASSDFTVSAWVRLPAGTQTSHFPSKWTTVVSTEASGGWEVNVGHSYNMDHSEQPQTLHFGFWKGPGPNDYEGDSCLGAPLDHWSQVAGVVDTLMSTYTVYRDGVQCFSTTTPNTIKKGSATLTIGQWPAGGRFLVGDVDDIAIWSRALEPSEIVLLTQTSVPPSL
jgi:hypothetical protein